MGTDPLHIKYRPKEFVDVVGQDAIVESIRQTISNQKFYLLYGMRGTGKTTIAYLIADALGCRGSGLVKINASSRNKIEDARAVENDCMYFPVEGDVTVYIFDEAHRLTPDAQNALLTLLEEPPPHIFFIFCSTEPNKLLKTVRSRAASYEFKPILRKDIKVILDRVCKKEGIVLDPKAHEWVVENSEGIPRDALILLDQIKDMKDLEKIKEIILLSSEDEADVRELCRVVFKGEKWKDALRLVDKLNADPERIRRALLGYLSSVLKMKFNKDEYAKPDLRVIKMMNLFLVPFYDTGVPGLIHALARIFSKSY